MSIETWHTCSCLTFDNTHRADDTAGALNTRDAGVSVASVSASSTHALAHTSSSSVGTGAGLVVASTGAATVGRTNTGLIPDSVGRKKGAFSGSCAPEHKRTHTEL